MKKRRHSIKIVNDTIDITRMDTTIDISRINESKSQIFDLEINSEKIDQEIQTEEVKLTQKLFDFDTSNDIDKNIKMHVDYIYDLSKIEQHVNN